MITYLTQTLQLTRPNPARGRIVFPDGNDYYYGSGSPTNPNHPSCPLGSSRFNVIQPAPHLPGGEGFMLYGAANGFDPLVNRVRKSIMIHQGRTDDPQRLQSWGCFSIQKSAWEDFKMDVERYVNQYGDLWLNVNPTGPVTITLQPVWDDQGNRI